MSNIRYELTEEESVNFRPKLLYLSTSKFESDWHSTPHYHPFSEIMFITGGAGTFLLDKKVYPISRGDLVVVSPNIMHTEYSSADSPLEYMIIGVDNIAFDLLVEDEESESDLPPTIFHFFNHYDKTYYYLQELNKELVNKRPNYQIMSQHIVNVLLLYIMRHSNLKTSIPSVNKTKYVNRECAFVKQYIDQHYADNISLDQLANRAFVNKFHLIHVFTKQFGVSPINYLIERRLEESKFLLKNTHMSVTDVSKAVGISSPAFFTKRFKTSVGCTPLSFRKNTAQ